MSEAKTKSTKAAKKPAETATAASAPATPPPPAPKAVAPTKPEKAAPKKSATTIVLNVDDKPAAKAAPKSRKPADPKTKANAAPTQSNLPDQSVIDKMVAEAAYYLAEKRNFATGFEEEDWLKAKEQIMSQLLAAKKPGKS
ncbi:MAG: DUF2934 domain-containing protein [Methylococcaceae bacterium]|nr:DUF2934 domain-containing protein [Desulfuromonas sp.]NJD07179.1 DUF2934 domain-containing protein [Methylococcaceae bacterium]